MRIFIFFLVIIFSQGIFAQVQTEQQARENQSSYAQEGDSLKIFQPTQKDYVFWYQDEKRQRFDTALSLENQYRYTQFNNKDNFGKIQFNNNGQPFNTLMYSKENRKLQYVPTGKIHFLQQAEEIRYYDVKTPATELIYHNGMKEGQTLGTLLTYSPNSKINFSLEYKGNRSLGHYVEEEVDSRNFIATLNYHTANRRYKLWTHYYNLNYGSVENGGLQNIEYFTSGNRNFRNRQRLLTNLTGVKSKFLYARYFIGQEFALIRKSKDTLHQNPLVLRNDFSYESMNYRYLENNSNSYFIPLSEYLLSGFSEVNTYDKNITNKSSLVFNWKEKLRVQAGVQWLNIGLSTKDAAVFDNTPLPASIKDNRFGFFGNLNGVINNKFQITANAEFLTGNFFKSTYSLNAKASYEPKDNLGIEFHIANSAQTPNLVLLYNPSIYKNFNYFLSNFSNENHSQLGGTIDLKKFKTRLYADVFSISNYTYLNHLGQTAQADKSTQILQLGFNNTIGYRKFHLNTQLTFQQLSANKDLLPLPSLVGRLNVYYKSMMFKNAANVQIGLKTYFFTKFNSRNYFPINNQFSVQEPGTETSIGGYPLMDFYFNMRVKSMQIYLEAQHFNGPIKYNYLVVPNMPYFDFRLNIGIVWYLFT